MDAAALKALKKKYMPFDIYLLPCSKCSDGLMALHLEKCLKPGCNSTNDFQEQFKPNHKQWEACLAEINALTWWCGPDRQIANLKEEPIKLKDFKTKSLKPLNDPQPCLAEAKPKFEPDC